MGVFWSHVGLFWSCIRPFGVLSCIHTHMHAYIYTPTHTHAHTHVHTHAGLQQMCAGARQTSRGAWRQQNSSSGPGWRAHRINWSRALDQKSYCGIVCLEMPLVIVCLEMLPLYLLPLYLLPVYATGMMPSLPLTLRGPGSLHGFSCFSLGRACFRHVLQRGNTETDTFSRF